MSDQNLTRRTLLKGIGAAAGTAVIGCGTGVSGVGNGDGSNGGDITDALGPDVRETGADVADVADASLDSGAADVRIEAGADAPGDAGGRCAIETTLTPEQLLAQIDTIVVLCMENRSFDHYLGSLRLAEGRMDVDGLLGSERNLDPAGAPVEIHRLDDFTPEDPPHNWDACHAQWNNGANDGFVVAHAGGSQRDVMGYHVREQLPATYALADSGAICDRWFCSVLGPTWPNRFYLHGASSNGNRSNAPALGFTSIFDRLDAAGVSHRNYYHDVPWATGGYFKTAGLANIERYFEDAAAGTLPRFSLIDPKYFGAGANDDHPDHDVQLGQALIASVFNALARGPQWPRSLFVLTYDEHGGFYDHVPPPTVTDERADFRRLGFRVPTLVAGPFVKRGCVVRTVFEHSSVIATLTRRFGLTPLNARATATNDLSSCIDPGYLTNPQAPAILPAVTISMSRMRSGRAPSNEHPELAAALDARALPRHIDRRWEGAAVTERVLRYGQRVGAVRLIE